MLAGTLLILGAVSKARQERAETGEEAFS